MNGRQFGSDNYAGICPEAWGALERANGGHALPYGEDQYTARAADLLREFFETRCEVFFVFNGTSANSLALASLCQSYHSILCHELAHVEMDECGGPEFFSNGTKLLLVAGENGKMRPGAIEAMARKRDDLHFPKARALSVTQATECGTVYSVEELGAIGETARRCGLRVHMDGARFANALASVGCRPAEMTWRAGVDVMSLGGTKNGLSVGEAVVFFDLDLAKEFEYRCKQAGQLASKMRFLSAPWVGVLESGAYLKNAQHANAMAKRLEAGLRGAAGVEIVYPVQANAVFVRMAKERAEKVRAKGWRFYDFIGSGGYRLMTAWDTREEDVDGLVRDIKETQA